MGLRILDFGGSQVDTKSPTGRMLLTMFAAVPNLHVLTITTNATHARKLVDHLRDHVPHNMQKRFAVSVDITFGSNWHVPDGPLAHVLTDTWTTIDGGRDLSLP